MPYSTEKFHDARVLVVGDLILDQYWSGPTSRISPEAPVPVVHVANGEERPGGAANVASNVRSLGAQVSLVGVHGEDAEGERLCALLQAAGVDAALVAQSEARTVTKLRVISQHQQLLRLDFEDAHGYPAGAPIRERVAARLEGAGALVLSDYSKGTLQDAGELIALANERQCPVVVDPKGDFQRYRGATLLTPNLREFRAAAGECRDDREIVQQAKRLCLELGLQALVVTRGEDGMTLVPRHEAAVHYPAQARDVYDVTGAGDTVIAVLGLALAAGFDLHQAVALANTAAGIAVGKLGAATLLPEELDHALHVREGNRFGLLNDDELLSAVQTARRRGETIVMTNGCFDILHAGHVAYLKQARELGDRLIVALNDDASVQRLKGPTRPINTLQHRAAVLAALSCVDWVVPFSDDTPEQLIHSVLPDILTKGGDYRPQDIAGGDSVTAAGGEVIVLPFVEHCSTTRIIESVRDTGEQS